jgi:hypothetical protein
MMKTMCLSARKELLQSVKEKRRRTCWQDKRKTLDGLIAATEYDRKYSICLLRATVREPQLPVKRIVSQKYNG